MEEQHERLFDLIESKSFEELNEEEKSFVLAHLTETEYSMQRKVISATTALEYDSMEPLALQVPKTKKNLLNRSIPLYQVLIGAACIVILFRIGNIKSYSLNWHFSEYPLEISLTNGASSGKIIHDTILKEIPVFRSTSNIIHDTVTIVQSILQKPEKRMLEADDISYPELSEKLLESKSAPIREDHTTQFLPSNPVISTMK